MNAPSVVPAEIIDKGYAVVPGVLDQTILDELRTVTDELLRNYSAADREKYKYQGSNIAMEYQHPVFARLIAWPRTIEALAEFGFDDPRYWSGYILSKPPHAPPLYWHQDWWAWDEPISADPVPAQLFLMYYLTDTRRENGCLRVIPGTHRRRISFHDELDEPHTDKSYHADVSSPLFRDHPDAVDVPVHAGDLVLGDARVLHAAHANQTDQRRTLLTLWYFGRFHSLPESLQATVAGGDPSPPTTLEPELRRSLEPLSPRYRGTATPAKWNRIPGAHLKP